MTTEVRKSSTRPTTRVPVETRPRVPRRERPRFPLVLKLFLLTALVVLFVVALAIGITINRANAVATASVNKSISGAATLFKEFERTRLQELTLGAYTLGRDPAFVAYVESAQQGDASATDPAVPPSEPAAPAAGAPPSPEGATASPIPPAAADSQATESAAGASDVGSIFDQLLERKTLLGSDLLIATDSEGIVLARTDNPNLTGGTREDLYESQPLVKASVDASGLDPVSGVMSFSRKLYHAAVAPMSIGAGGIKSGYVINAYEIDDAFANQIARTTQAEVVFTPAAKGESSASRSADAPSVERLSAAGEVDRVVKSGRSLPPHPIRIGEGGKFVVTGEPLTAQGKTVGAALFVRSLDRELAPFREIQKTLVGAGALALLLAFLFSWIVAKRLTRPIEQLAGFAQSVTEGNYDVQPDLSRSDEVGILSRAFAQMVSSLRDKAELEELYAQMSSRVEERGERGEGVPPSASEGTIMVTDLRGIGVGGKDPVEVIAEVERAMRVQETEVRRQEGEVLEIVGHRLVCTFAGERSILHAIRAARAISEELASQFAGPQPLSVGVGIATGSFVSGSVDLAETSGLALVGNTPLLALLFAWEAPGGHAYVSLETAQAASTDLLTSATREEIRLRWLPTPLPLVSVPLHTITTGMIRSIAGGTSTLAPTAQMATVRLDGEQSEPPLGYGGQSDLTPGALFANRYVIDQVIGRGGMGVVYRATDSQLDETVAIKTLPGDAMQRSAEELERFKREIRLARKITHRNVLRTYDYGEANGVYFISMEYVRGYTLAELLEEKGHMAPRLAMSIARQICRGLQVAHEEGIIHRDIKPQNVLVDQRGQVKLMDFGIARMAETTEAMTSAGLIVGTPHYMSPEQVQGKALDARSDVYSMGVMMYEMVLGARPFNSSSLAAVLTAHITERPKPPVEIRPEIGGEISRIILRALEKDPAKRYANAGELLDDLDKLQATSKAA